MTDDAFDRDSWEHRWARVLEANPELVTARPPNSYLMTTMADARPGRALDAGCGHGAEAIWLALAGWQVTAVDFSTTALEFGAATAAEAGVADRVAWVQGDLGTWTPPPRRFDLVNCLYVHVAGSVVDLVRRLADGVAPGGTLLLVGHRAVDPATGLPSPAAGQVQISVEEALEVLRPPEWRLLLAEEQPRPASGEGVDAMIHAVRAGAS
jgi:SAM-dependent methyltransferase